jgi:arylsulfatase A-like enzyme
MSYSDPAKNLPNIIFILTDDQRWDSVGFMGQKIGKTPHLDQLAKEGYVFENAFVTSAICTPSRVSYFLGQYERRHGVNFNSGTALSQHAWETAYPTLLKKAGYTTAYIGKNHVPIGETGYRSGHFETSFDFWYAGHNHLGFYPKQRHPIFSHAEHDTQTEILCQGVQAFLIPSAHRSFYESANVFLHHRNPTKPFCLTISLNLPHSFSVSRMKQKPTDNKLYRTSYRDQLHTQPLPPFYIPKNECNHPKLPADILFQDLRQSSYDWVNTEKTLREHLIRTMQTITGIDQMIGTLRNTLTEHGLNDNTILIFTSDHGLQNGEFGLGGKALCYDTCLRVPLLIYDPREPGGEQLPHLIQSIDIAPTLLHLAGITPPNTMQGKSLLPLIRKQKTAWRTAAFGENLWSNQHGNPRCETVRTEQYRYIRYFQNDRHEKIHASPQTIAQAYAHSLTASIQGEPIVFEELYHTAIDPYEATNLIHHADYAEIADHLRSQCAQLVLAAKGDLNQPPATTPFYKTK